MTWWFFEDKLKRGSLRLVHEGGFSRRFSLYVALVANTQYCNKTYSVTMESFPLITVKLVHNGTTRGRIIFLCMQVPFNRVS